MKYEAIGKLGKIEIEKALKRNNAEELLRVVLSVALYSEDFEENFCLQLTNHENFNVRGNAILGFGHIARIHGKLTENKVKLIIENALKDDNEFVRGQAHGAKDDTEFFLNWSYGNERNKRSLR
jgi:hypothetical protein